MQAIKTEFKRTMLQRFAMEHTLKDMEGLHVLDFLHQNDEWLERLHFVRDASTYSNRLVLTADGVDGPALCLVAKEMTPQQSDTAQSILSAFRYLNYIQKTRGISTELYLQLNFVGSEQHMVYQTVLEDRRTKEEILSEEQKENEQLANNIISEALSTFELNYLQTEINRSLDNKDEERFYELTNKLKEITLISGL